MSKRSSDKTRTGNGTRAAGIRVRVSRSNLNDDYLICPNALFRGVGVYAGLSEYARLWLGAGLSCANEWDTTLDDIEEWLPSLGRDRHEAVRRELRERGFLSMSRTQIPAGEPDGGKFIWTFAFFMDPLPVAERDQLQPKGTRKRGSEPRGPESQGIDDPIEQVDETAGGAMPGSPGHPRPGHGGPGPGDQGDVNKKNHLEKNHPPLTPVADAAASTTAGAATREGEESPFDEETRQALSNCVQRVHALRPAWAPRAITAAMRQALDDGRAPNAVIAAMVAVAKDSTSKVPGRLNTEGDWWGAAPARIHRPSSEVPRCRKQGHERQAADGCVLCAAEAKAGQHVDADRDQSVDPEAEAKAAAYLAGVRERRARRAGAAVPAMA